MVYEWLLVEYEYVLHLNVTEQREDTRIEQSRVWQHKHKQHQQQQEEEEEEEGQHWRKPPSRWIPCRRRSVGE